MNEIKPGSSGPEGVVIQPEVRLPTLESMEQNIPLAGDIADELEEAKKIIEEASSDREDIRRKVIRELRSEKPSNENIEHAKAQLAAAPIKEIAWLIRSVDEVQNCPEVALFMEKVARSGELKDDPRWLTAQAMKLVYTTDSMTAGARREVSSTVSKVRGRIHELSRQKPDQEMHIETFDRLLYGSELKKNTVPAKEKVYDEEKPENDAITDPDVIRLLREVNRKIRTDPLYLDDPRRLENDVQTITSVARERSLPDAQAVEANTRIRELQRKKIEEIQGKQAERERYKFIRWGDIKETVSPGERPPGRLDSESSPGIGSMSAEDIALLKTGCAGEEEWFFKFIDSIYRMGRTPDRADLPEQYMWHDFENYIKWKYPENTHFYLDKYEYIWKESARNSQIIKNLLFTPGDPKDKIKNLQFLTPGDFDHYMTNYDYANYAASLYEEVVFDTLAEHRREYDEALTFLWGKDGKDPANIEKYKKLLALRNSGSLDSHQAQELADLQEKVDEAGTGVMLWDSDVQNNTELQMEIGSMYQEMDRIRMKEAKGEKLTDWEKEHMRDLPKHIERKRAFLEQKKQREGIDDIPAELQRSSNMSPIDMEVQERLEILLIEKDIEIKDWKVKRAIWAARQAMIGSGRLVTIGSSMVTRPAHEFRTDPKLQALVAKYIMRSAAFEDLQRIINPDLFQDRFGMADVMGDVYRASLRTHLFESKGYHFKNDRKYKRDNEKDADPIVRMSREFARQVENETGIPYSEMLNQGFFEAGGIFDQTSWRLEAGVLDERRAYLADLKNKGIIAKDAQIDNQALGVQLLLLGTGKENAAGRKVLIEKIVERNPGKLLQILGKPVDEIYKKNGMTPEDQTILKRALSIAQIRIWDDTKLAVKDIRFCSNEKDFNAVIRPILKGQGVPEDEVRRYFNVLQEAYTEFTVKREEYKNAKGSLQYETRLDAWANHRFPMTILLSDFDWKEVNFFKLGTIAIDRRGRDMWGMAQAKDAWIMMQKPEILCAKDSAETLKKLKEFREAMNLYTYGAAAEKATYELAHAWLDFNKNRSIQWWNPSGWIPGMHQGMKGMAEADWEHSNIGKITKKIFGEKAAIKVKNFPKRIAEKMSYSVRFTGPQGNAFEEKEIDHILDEMLKMGIFNAQERLYHTLREEFRASRAMQVLGLIRKYWWIIPLATIAMAAKEESEKESKAHH